MPKTAIIEDLEYAFKRASNHPPEQARAEKTRKQQLARLTKAVKDPDCQIETIRFIPPFRPACKIVYDCAHSVRMKFTELNGPSGDAIELIRALRDNQSVHSLYLGEVDYYSTPAVLMALLDTLRVNITLYDLSVYFAWGKDDDREVDTLYIKATTAQMLTLLESNCATQRLKQEEQLKQLRTHQYPAAIKKLALEIIKQVILIATSKGSFELSIASLILEYWFDDEASRLQVTEVEKDIEYLEKMLKKSYSFTPSGSERNLAQEAVATLEDMQDYAGLIDLIQYQPHILHQPITITQITKSTSSKSSIKLGKHLVPHLETILKILDEKYALAIELDHMKKDVAQAAFDRDMQHLLGELPVISYDYTGDDESPTRKDPVDWLSLQQKIDFYQLCANGKTYAASWYASTNKLQDRVKPYLYTSISDQILSASKSEPSKGKILSNASNQLLLRGAPPVTGTRITAATKQQFFSHFKAHVQIYFNPYDSLYVAWIFTRLAEKTTFAEMSRECQLMHHQMYNQMITTKKFPKESWKSASPKKELLDLDKFNPLMEPLYLILEALRPPTQSVAAHRQAPSFR